MVKRRFRVAVSVVLLAELAVGVSRPSVAAAQADEPVIEAGRTGEAVKSEPIGDGGALEESGSEAPLPAPVPFTAEDAGRQVLTGVQRSDSAEGYVEGRSVIDVERTTATDRVWSNPDGSETVELAAGPVRFLSEKAEWVEIDPTLLKSDGGFSSTATEQALAVAGKPSVDEGLLSLSGGLGVGLPLVGDGEALQLGSMVPVTSERVPDGLAVAGSDGAGRTVEVASLASGFNVSVRFDSLKVAGDGSWVLPLVLPRGSRVVADRGEIVAFAADGAELGHFGNGVAFDASGPGSEVPATVSVVERAESDAGIEVKVRVAVDAAWLSDPKREFPLTVDPTWSYTTAGADDTYVASHLTAAQGSSSIIAAGSYSWAGVMRTHRGLVTFGLPTANIHPDRAVTSATLTLAQPAVSSPYCTGTSGVWANTVASSWTSASTVWSDQPLLDTWWPTATATLNCSAQTVTMNPTGSVQRWMDGGLSNFGVRLSGESDMSFSPVTGSYHQFWSANAGSHVAPKLTFTYEFRPPVPTPASPADGATTSTLTPTLSVNPVTDGDGDAVKYWFRLFTSTPSLDATGHIVNVGGTAIDSGLLDAPSWTVPDGLLADGARYFWTVVATDQHSIPKIPTWFRSLWVDSQLGGAGPVDSVGPVSTNLVTGNVSVTAGTRQLSALGGQLGASFTYNSAERSETGLTGEYYADGNSNNTFDDPLVLSRTDNVVSFDHLPAEGVAPGAGSDNFLVRWSGKVTPDATGSYKVGSPLVAGTGMTVSVGGTTVLNAWTNTTNQYSESAAVSLTAGTPVDVVVEYRQDQPLGGTSRVMARLGTGDPFIIPTGWLTPKVETPAVLGVGWSHSLDAGIPVARVNVEGNTAVVEATDGSALMSFIRTGDDAAAGWTPERGDVTATLVPAASGGMVLTIGQMLFRFRPDGNLESAAPTTDSANSSGNIASVDLAYASITSGGRVYPRIASQTDTVTGRQVTFTYAGQAGATCAGAPAGFDGTPPAGRLCKVDYWDGTSTSVFYLAGRLGRVVNPGGETTDFAYDGSGRLSKVRDPLAADAIAAGVRVDNDSTRWLIAYDGATWKGTGVTAPEPTAGAARPGHTYSGIGSGVTNTAVAGVAPSSGYSSQVSYDSEGTVTETRGADGLATTPTYDEFDRVVAVNGPDGSKSTTVYDTNGNQTDSWGPAPAAWWSTNGAPDAAHQAATAHTSIAYDEGFAGLGTSWFATADMSGELVDTTLGGLGTAGAIDTGFSGKTAPYSLFATGRIDLSSAGDWQFRAVRDGQVRVWIDGTLVVDAWDDASTTTAPVTKGVATAGVASVMIQYANPSGAGQLQLQQLPPGGSWAVTPGPALKPGWDLQTSTTAPSGTVTANNYTDPARALASGVTVDPGGLALTTSATTEPVGTGYGRRLTRTLPAGAGSTVNTTFWGDTVTADNPCTPGTEAFAQSGALRYYIAADPDGAGALVPVKSESIYDDAGRQVAVRVGPDDGSFSSLGWACTSYDSRGRVAEQKTPAFGGQPARTATFTYSVSANPLWSTVIDPAGTVTVGVDLLGRTVSYTDVWNVTTTTVYDQAGRAVETTSSKAATVTNTYDSLSRVTAVDIGGSRAANVTYDALSRPTAVSYPSGTGNAGNDTSGAWTYDQFGRPATVRWTGPAGTITSSGYTYNAAGQIVDETVDGVDPYPAGGNFVYDAVGRLTGARTTSGFYEYGYASTGGCGLAASAGKNSNRTSTKLNGTLTGTYCYDHADRLTSTTTAGYGGAIGYDGHGNTTAIAGETRVYDWADRHVSTVKAGVATVTYTRDGTNRIVARVEAGVGTQRYSHGGGSDSPSLVLDSSNNLADATYGLPGGVAYAVRGATTKWLYPNLHGDVVATANNTGAKQGVTVAYDPYGNTTTNPDTRTGNFDDGWLGTHQRPLEHAAGLRPTTEMGARQYDPILGRFLETDPVEGGVDNPYNYPTDPYGTNDVSGTWRLYQDHRVKVDCGYVTCTAYFRRSFVREIAGFMNSLYGQMWISFGVSGATTLVTFVVNAARVGVMGATLVGIFIAAWFTWQGWEMNTKASNASRNGWCLKYSYSLWDILLNGLTAGSYYIYFMGANHFRTSNSEHCLN